MLDVLSRDGVVDIEQLVTASPVTLLTLPAGPRGWQLTGVDVDTVDGRVARTRLEWRAAGDRSAVVCRQAPRSIDGPARQVATALAFRSFQRVGAPGGPPAFLAGFDAAARWGAVRGNGWRAATLTPPAGGPVRLRARSGEDGATVLGVLGVAEEEVDVMLGQLTPLAEHDAEALRREHRRAIAQRWWDAPRTPWTGHR